METSSKTQNEHLLRELHKGPITASQAQDRLGIARLAARVFELRQDGWDIASTQVTVFNRHREACKVAQYRLASVERGLLPVQLPGRGRLSA